MAQYAVAEMVDMVFCYGVCQQNLHATVRGYAARFLIGGTLHVSHYRVLFRDSAKLVQLINVTNWPAKRRNE